MKKLLRWHSCQKYLYYDSPVIFHITLYITGSLISFFRAQALKAFYCIQILRVHVRSLTIKPSFFHLFVIICSNGFVVWRLPSAVPILSDQTLVDTCADHTPLFSFHLKKPYRALYVVQQNNFSVTCLMYKGRPYVKAAFFFFNLKLTFSISELNLISVNMSFLFPLS